MPLRWPLCRPPSLLHRIILLIADAEYETSTDGSATWANPTHFEYYEMGSDPWQLKNAYTGMNVTTRGHLHTTVQSWLHCSGSTCP